MKIFLDSSDISEIKLINKSGLIDGITTNPSLLAKQEGDFKKILKTIATEVKGPISAEVTATHTNKMIEEAKKGPTHAQIRNVSVEERKYSGDFKEFKVLRI